MKPSQITDSLLLLTARRRGAISRNDNDDDDYNEGVAAAAIEQPLPPRTTMGHFVKVVNEHRIANGQSTTTIMNNRRINHDGTVTAPTQTTIGLEIIEQELASAIEVMHDEQARQQHLHHQAANHHSSTNDTDKRAHGQVGLVDTVVRFSARVPSSSDHEDNSIRGSCSTGYYLNYHQSQQ